MKIDFKPYFLLFILLALATGSLRAQESRVSSDSLKNRLEGLRSEQTLVIRDDFLFVWPRLGSDFQDRIMGNVSTIMNKRYNSKKLLDAYFHSIASAKDIERLDNKMLTSFLNVAEKMIERDKDNETMLFFNAAIQFFENRALFYSRSNRLYVQNDTYSFQYIEDVIEEEFIEEPVEEPETEEGDEEWFDDWDEEAPDEDWDTEWEEDEEYSPEEAELSDEELLTEAITATGGAALPVITGPVIKFESLDLNFVTGYDSVFLKNTSGTYMLVTREFAGNGGRFNWTMAGLGADSVFADLREYGLDVTKPALKAESAQLTYAGKVDNKVDGVFQYRSVAHDSTTDASYPRFQSYYSNIKVRGFSYDFSYQGGFSLNGAKINSSSLFGKNSLIEVQGETSKLFKARAKFFEFQDSIVTALRASVVIYQNNDSIYHPAVRVKYDIDNKNLILQKDKGGFKNTPFTSSYFNIDFTADIIRWDMESDSLDASILAARTIVPAYFESSDHYNYNDYTSLGDRIYDFNPLGIVAYYAEKEGVDEFYVADLARFYKKKERIIRGAMTFLAQKGLIGYDSNDGLITLKEKTRHLFDAKRGRKDYDNIIIKSITAEKPNATINFKDRYMRVRGVESFKISDSLNVVIEPDSSEITLMKNRDFKFNGKVYAGNFEYIGRDFTFKYDSFLIYLNQIDSIEFFVKDENSRGTRGTRKINNALVSADSVLSGGTNNAMQGGSGTLYVNKPGNKSSKKKYLDYPSFTSERGQVAYFDRSEILGGVYDRSLYFLIPPFDLDSLGGSDPAAIGFRGTFNSSGMFPAFEETLRIQPDYSLGFQHEIPPEGYKLYEGEGRLYSTLSMDSRGLRADGKIDFLTSSMESKDFIFYPDSVTGSGQLFEMKEAEYNGVAFPQASLENYEMKWLPKKDSMYIKNVEEPIQFYNETASLDGSAIITNSGVFGSGLLATRGSESTSDEISLGQSEFSARHAQFDLKSNNPDKAALYGNDVKLKFDLDENYALISPEVEGEAAIEFPYAQFKTSITEARWDLEEERITMTKPEDVPIESSYFYTTREDLDSLRFNATKAEYDINTLELKVSGIPYIIVADAKITPENNEVLILENSKIGQLANTTIILDTLNGYHRLTDGVIDIKSRNEFSGYATYQFVNALNDTIPIKMENFRLEEIYPDGARKKDLPEQHTVANGAVLGNDNVLISPGMFYKGELILYAHQPAMELSGFVKLDLKEPGYDTWIKHSSSADQHEVVIDYDNGTTQEGRRLEAGLHFSAGDNSLYHSFITEKFSPDDEDFFSPSGVLFYDKTSGEFVIEDSLKASGKTLAGKIFRYNESSSELKFEGPVSFIPETKDVEIKASALGTANINEVKYKLNTLFSVLFKPVPTSAFDAMSIDVLDVVNNLGAPEGLGDPTELLYKLADLAGERAAREYEKQSLEAYVPLAGFTKETSASMVFADVNMEWSVDHNAFYSTGKLGLSNIRSTDINGAFDGFLEAKRNEAGGAIFNLFLKASADSWYYFSYEDNRLLIFSSNNAFNTIISKKSNGAKAKIDELVFAPADRAETLNFVNRFRLQYYGIEDPYQLDSGVEEEVQDQTEEETDDDGFDDDDDGF